MKDTARLQLIEKFHSGQLGSEEQNELNALIEADPNFKAELEDYSFLLDGFQMLEMEAFETEMNSWEQKHKASLTLVEEAPKEIKTFKLSKFTRYISAAAAVLLIASLPVIYLSTNNTVDPFDELYMTPMNIDAHRASPRTDEDGNKIEQTPQELALNSAFLEYTNQHYDQAIVLLNQYIDQYGNKEYKAMFFLAISQIEIKQYQEASMNLEFVMENATNSYFVEEAQWFLSLIQYKMGNHSVAKTLAKKIADNPSHSHVKNAESFLEKAK